MCYLYTHSLIALPPQNFVAGWNPVMCRPLNRKGRVCSECVEGYGPTVMLAGFDIQWQCSNCTGAWYGIPLFLFLEFFPITLFYLAIFIIVIFQINITSGSITCFIMYSQLLIISFDRIASGYDIDISNTLLTASPNSKLFLKIIAYNLRHLEFSFLSLLYSIVLHQ